MSPGRIVVTLETHPKAKSAVDTAARLAARLQAELLALVVEDIQLLHFAALPFAREVGHVSAHSRELDVATLERSFRSMASDAERWLKAAAERAPMQWSLQVTRGARIEQILATATDTDLIVSGNAVILFCSDKAQASALERDALAALHSAGRRSIGQLHRAADRSELRLLLRDAG